MMNPTIPIYANPDGRTKIIVDSKSSGMQRLNLCQMPRSAQIIQTTLITSCSSQDRGCLISIIFICSRANSSFIAQIFWNQFIPGNINIGKDSTKSLFIPFSLNIEHQPIIFGYYIIHTYNYRENWKLYIRCCRAKTVGTHGFMCFGGELNIIHSVVLKVCMKRRYGMLRGLQWCICAFQSWILCSKYLCLPLIYDRQISSTKLMRHWNFTFFRSKNCFFEILFDGNRNSECKKFLSHFYRCKVHALSKLRHELLTKVHFVFIECIKIQCNLSNGTQ